MPNLDPWINQQNSNNEVTTTSKFENHFLSIRDEHQNRIGPKHHPTYNERQQNIIEMIDWTLEKYKARIKETKHNEQVIIDDIIEELDKKRDIAIHKKKQALLKDEVWKYGGEENSLDYVLFRIRELTGKLV